MSLGPAELQVLISRLTGVAEEMGAVLRRAAFSPNIKERADCSAALFTPSGELLVQAEHIPVHLGSMPASVGAAIEAFGDSLDPGDQVVLNDPFAGGTHLNDITLVAPCVVDGELVGWAANRAHHADVGGSAPGSIPADATEIHQEGLRIPPTRLDESVRRLLLANSRTPTERIGDLDAQVGANVVGVERLAEMTGPDAPLRRGGRLRRAAHAGGARRRCPTGPGGRRRAGLDRCRPGAAASGARRRGRHGHRRRGDVRLHRHRPPGPRQRQRRGGGHGLGGRRTRCAPRSIRPFPPTAEPCARCGWWRRRARSSPRDHRRRSAPATSR